MIIYFENEIGGLKEVDYKTQNFVVLDNNFRDACVGGMCESILTGWRSTIGSIQPSKYCKIGNRQFEWDSPYWCLIKE